MNWSLWGGRRREAGGTATTVFVGTSFVSERVRASKDVNAEHVMFDVVEKDAFQLPFYRRRVGESEWRMPNNSTQRMIKQTLPEEVMK